MMPETAAFLLFLFPLAQAERDPGREWLPCSDTPFCTRIGSPSDLSPPRLDARPASYPQPRLGFSLGRTIPPRDTPLEDWRLRRWASMYTSSAHGVPLTAAPRAPSRSQEDGKVAVSEGNDDGHQGATWRTCKWQRTLERDTTMSTLRCTATAACASPDPLRPAARLKQPRRRQKGWISGAWPKLTQTCVARAASESARSHKPWSQESHARRAPQCEPGRRSRLPRA